MYDKQILSLTMSGILSYFFTFHFISLFKQHRRWIEKFRTSLPEQDITCEGIDQSESLLFPPVSQTHQVVDLHGLLSELTASIGAGRKKVAALRKLWILDLFVSSTSSWVKIYLNAIQKYVYLFSVVYVICRHVDNVWESSFKIISGRVVASSPCGTLDLFSGNLKLCEIPFSYQRMKKSDTVK